MNKIKHINENYVTTPSESSNIKEFPEISSFDTNISTELSVQITQALEDGFVVLFPNLRFPVNEDEKEIITPSVCNGRSKNISYDISDGKLSGTKIKASLQEKIISMMHRYAELTKQLMDSTCPHYKDAIVQKRTSYRPVEIKGRVARHYTQDDTRLHVDAFPMNPTGGKRILRVFSNINPNNKPRKWRLGESFEKVAKTFLPTIKAPLWGSRTIMKWLGITKTYRTDYDHIMLNMHDNMKLDMGYQKNVSQEYVDMPANTVWMVYTDKASHGVLEGQYLLEQTFYLESKDMLNPEKSPLSILEKQLGKRLV